MYRYLPSYAFALTLLADYVAKLGRLHPRSALGFILVVALVSAYFVPVWGEFPVSQAAAKRRLLFHSRRPD